MTRVHDGMPAGPAIASPDFPLEPAGFEGRGMRLHLSIWTAPKLILDGRPLVPGRSGLFAGTREYRALNNAGTESVIVLRRRPLDQIPAVVIDGIPFPVARPLSPFEYVWMCLPVPLVVLGGALGAAAGLSAVYANAILMRRIVNPAARYLFTGAATALAFLLFAQSVSALRPLLGTLGLGGASFDDRLQEAADEMNRNCPVTLDQETRLDSATAGAGATLTYHYTLLRAVAGGIDTGSLRQYLRPNVLRTIRTQEGLRFLREHDVTFVYRYLDRHGSLALELRVTPGEYRE